MNVRALSGFHAQGLGRFTTIIDANPNYHTILNRRGPDPELDFFDTDADVAEKASRAIEICRKRLSTPPFRTIRPSTEIGYYGSTDNNIREFHFISEVSGIPFLNKQENYYNLERLRAPSSDDATTLIDVMMKDIEAFYWARATISQSLLRQQILYSRSYLSFSLSFRDPKAVKPKLFVVANDHSPVQVALSMTMKDAGVPRMYVQHAEVSSSFPPLDFEISVLRNQVSLETYKRIGPISGSAFVIAREISPPNAERLKVLRGKPIRAVVYPTARVIPDSINRLVAALNQNPDIEGVAVKPHPGSSPPLDEVLAEPAEMLSSLPDTDHIAIVGNSSIVVELLRKGVPVYQNFDFDPVMRDYYGFVSRGLTPEVPTDRLSEQFWEPYQLGEAWWTEYNKLDPSGDPEQPDARLRLRAKVEMLGLSEALGAASQEVVGDGSLIRSEDVTGARAYFQRKIERKREKFRRRIKSLRKRLGLPVKRLKPVTVLAVNPIEVSAPKMADKLMPATDSQKRLLWKALVELSDLPDWLEENEQTSSFDTMALITLFEWRFSERDPALIELFARHEWFPLRSSAAAWLSMKSSEWSRKPLSGAQLDELHDFIMNPDRSPAERTRLLSMLLARKLFAGSIDQVMRAYDSSWRGGKLSVSLSNQINLLRRVKAEGSAEQRNLLRRSMEENWSPLDRLKVANAEALAGDIVEDWTHDRALASLCEVAPRQTVREIEDLVMPVFQSFDISRMRMEVRFDADQKQDVLGCITAALKHGTPFSLVRLSDGEGYLFADPGYFFTAADSAQRELHWWGCRLQEDIRADVLKNALHAVQTADVVGVPSAFRFIRDCNPRVGSILSSIQGRGLIEVLSHVRRYVSDTALITEDKVNVALFSEIETLVRLSMDARKVVLVGSIKPEFLPQEIRELKNLECIAVPTHRRTRANPVFHLSDTALPFVAAEIERTVVAASQPGVLVLVAAGIAGKRFLGVARNAGGVALDLGNVIDDWLASGLTTIR